MAKLAYLQCKLNIDSSRHQLSVPEEELLKLTKPATLAAQMIFLIINDALSVVKEILRVGGRLHLTADTQKAVGWRVTFELELVLLQLASDTVFEATANQR